MNADILKTLQKAKQWELEIFAEEFGIKHVELEMDDVTDVIDSLKYLISQNEHFREILDRIKSLVKPIEKDAAIVTLRERRAIQALEAIEYILNKECNHDDVSIGNNKITCDVCNEEVEPQ